MSIAQLTAGTVMNKAAALMNDPTRSIYTYAVQVPYLQTAMQELQEYFALHNAPVTEKSSVTIAVDAGVTEVGYDSTAPAPELPDDMIEPINLWERARGGNDFVPMKRVTFLDHSTNSISQIGGYVWQEQMIKFLAANQDNDIQIDYLRQLFTDIVDDTSAIHIINGRTFLEYRTAGLLAEFIENNDPNTNRLNNYASLAMDRATGITVKGKQSIMTRRRPFRSGYR